MFDKKKKIIETWQKVGVAAIIQKDADTLNDYTEQTNLLYDIQSESSEEPELVDIDGTNVIKEDVINAINNANFIGVLTILITETAANVKAIYDSLSPTRKITIKLTLNIN